MLKFSLIVPAYQVEKFIKKCLDSCFLQDLQPDEYEVLVINDGSKDKSLEIAQDYLNNHSNIRIFSQQNMGLSEARNTGLHNALGKYIWFIDSDDWIEDNCLGEIYDLCEKSEIDILHFNAIDHKNNQEIIPEENKKFYNQKVSGKEYILNSTFVEFPVWLNIFRRSFLVEHKLFFKRGIYHEDNEFSPRAFYYAETIFFLEKSYYNIFHNTESITRTVNPKKSFDLIEVIRSSNDFLENNISEDGIKKKFYNYLGLALNSAVNNIIVCSPEDRHRFVNELKKNKEIINKIQESEILKYRIQASIFNISIPLYLQVYSILKRKN